MVDLPSPSEAGFISQQSAEAFARTLIAEAIRERRNYIRRANGGMHLLSKMAPGEIVRIFQHAQDAGIELPEDVR